jgi:hypothetical protein
MKYDFSTVVKDLSGVTVKDETGKDLTIKHVCHSALFAMIKAEDASGEEKYTRYRLAGKINGEGPADLRSEDVTKIKDLVGKAYGPLVVGFTYEFLENPIPSPVKAVE